MRLFVTALTFFALLAPQVAQATSERVSTLAKRDSLIHGIAGDERYVFVTEPGAGVSTDGPRVVVLDRDSGRQVGVLPAPPDGGFKLPFTLRVADTGRLVVLDAGGFPPQGPPIVYDYRYRTDRGRFKAELARKVDFAGNPMGFAEDVEVLPNGEYVVSESVFGGLWVIERDGDIRPALVPDPPTTPLPKLGPCSFGAPPSGGFFVGGLPFVPAGNFAPGAGSLAVHGRDLYVSSTCEGGVQRVPLRLLRDTRPAAVRAAEIDTVATRKYTLESLKGITFNQWDEDDPWIYAGDPFRLQLIRIHSRTGRREVIATDHKRFNFTVSTAFLPPERRGGPTPLVTASDQEYRWATLNTGIPNDMFEPPFIVGEYLPGRHHR